MTVQEIHRYIWDEVLAHPSADYSSSKERAVDALYDEGHISAEGHAVLRNHQNSVLCALYRCPDCPMQRLGGCRPEETSTYYRFIQHGHRDAAIAIRNLPLQRGFEDVERILEI